MGLENIQLGSYRLVSLVGKGGMAEVWLGTQLTLKRDVAVKIIANSSNSQLSDSMNLAARFEREAQSIARLDHPAILQVIDYGSTPEYLYLVMPFLRGGSLQDRIRKGTLTRGQAFDIFSQMLSGVGYAHSKGIIHRDLKPANILLADERRAVIADFGVAKTLADDVVLTQTGSAVGSPVYMSPEQFMGQADFRSDLYSMGVILYQLLTGRVVYSGTTSWEIAMKHFNDPLPLPNPLVPPQLEQFVARCLQKQPENRFSNAQEMEAAFHEAVRRIPPHELNNLPPRTPGAGGAYTPTPAPVSSGSGIAYPNSQGYTPSPTPMPGTTSNPTYAIPNPTPPVGSTNPFATASRPILKSKKSSNLVLIGGVSLLVLAITTLLLALVLSGSSKTTAASTTIAGAVNTTVAGNGNASLNVLLNPQNGTKVTGTGVIIDNGNGTVTINLTISGLVPGSHNAHVHTGTCLAQGVVKYPLTTLQAGADGKASSSTIVQASFTEITAGNLYLNVHNDAGTPTYVASCGDIAT
jgi:serine/threonine-protein kinase PpkA